MEAIDPFQDLFWSFRWELFRAGPNFDGRDVAETEAETDEGFDWKRTLFLGYLVTANLKGNNHLNAQRLKEAPTTKDV